MIRELGNIRHIFDEFEQDRVPIWDIIEMFQGGRDVRELDTILKERPRIASNVLYIMSELAPGQVVLIWRSAASFISSEDFDSVYYALDIIHGLLPQISKDEVALLLSEVRVHENSIDEKIRVITEALNSSN